MAYANALAAPNRQQFEVNSQWSQSWNCGPTCVSFIGGAFNGTRPGIEQNRRNIAGTGPYNVTGTGYVYGAPPQTPTTAWQQATMLQRLGVPCSVRYLDSIAQLHGLVDSNRRPTLIGILMARVPAGVRGHSFTGWHAVVVISGGYLNGTRGFWVMDPNFPAGGPSRRFYSDAVMQYAWAANAPRWGVVPTNAMPLPVTSPAPGAPPVSASTTSTIGGLPVNFKPKTGWAATIIKGKPRRAGASVGSKNYGNATKDERMTIIAEVAGQSFSANGGGRWFVGAQYVNGYKWVYVPLVDLKLRDFA